LILSSDFCLETVDLPKSDEELRRLGAAIASGEDDILDGREVQAVKAFLLAAERFQKRWTLSRVVVLGVVPVLLLLAFVVYLLSIVVSS
jgi:cytochrome c-type biogenesis protein CcmH/NrfG